MARRAALGAALIEGALELAVLVTIDARRAPPCVSAPGPVTDAGPSPPRYDAWMSGATALEGSLAIQEDQPQIHRLLAELAAGGHGS